MGHPARTEYDIRKRNKVNSETLSGNKTLSAGDATFQRLDPNNGSGRDVTLPSTTGNQGVSFRILNTADAAEDLTVKDSGGSTVVTISQNEAAWVGIDGSDSWQHLGIESISLS